MKSTKIEDILETVDEDILDDGVQEGINNVQNEAQVNNELKKQLDNLQNELSNIKQTDREVKQVSDTIPAKAAVQEVKQSISEKDTGLADKLLNFQSHDVKNAIIMILLFITMNSSHVNEIIDLYMPYSVFTYGYIVKAVIYFVIYRIITTIIS